SGRPYLVWNVGFSRPSIGDFDVELLREWFHAFVLNAGITMHVETLHGDNNHHIAESCYKALAHALRQAVELDPRQQSRIPSTKGILQG
ncbi:MAG: imidazoleglycerol-phosphate dehydratase, partial [Aestuariivirgaceae bacterium]